MDNQELAEELRKRQKEWEGKARANAVVDGPEDAYNRYLDNAAVLAKAAEIVGQES